MDPLTLIILLVLGFLFLNRSGVSLFGGIGSSYNSAYTPQAIPVAPEQDVVSAQQANQAIGTAAQGLNAIPLVGPVLSATFSAIASGLLKQHQIRLKQARDENTAVANAFPGWDQAMAQANSAYNSGAISASQVQQLVDLAWQYYWQEVSPYIQPGRNGCQSGTISKDDADRQFPGMAQCSGDWGAACCVGYADLANGAKSILAAVSQTERDGKPAQAYIPAVYASKYGGANRASYTLTFIRSSSSFVV